MNLVSRDVYMGLIYSENAIVVWKELNKTYDKVDGSIVYNLLQKLNTVKGGSSVADYYHRLNSIWREFDALTKLLKCTCDVKCSCDASKELGLHQQLMNLMQFLMGVDDCYQHVRSSLLTKDPLPEVKDVYNVISKEESYRGVLESSSGTEYKQNATSFVAKTLNNNKKQFNNNGNNFTRGTSSNVNKGPNPNLNCKYYAKIGHTIHRCFEIVGFPQGFKINFNSNTRKQYFNANFDVKKNDKPSPSRFSSGFTSEQIQKFLNLISKKPSGSIHASIAGRASFFNGNGGFPNSGANQHLTGSITGMNNVVDTSELKIIVGHLNDVENTSDVDHLQFFNSQSPQRPNDDGKESSDKEDDQYQNFSEGDLQSSFPSTKQSSPTHFNDDVQKPVIRRLDRQSKPPVRLNDYILGSNVKYGIEKYVSYSKLNSVNLCFATTLNKLVDPTCLSKALSEPDKSHE
uniref:Uncharacterized protein n=1 Tax=Tanacetum cinerariifolium TaxID=118510 RepID=A0A699I4W9_TANCI|nr:hypothetical protein [Tanacetum cinerariifolium]